MTSEPASRRRSARAVFERLLECAPEARPALLERACGADVALRREVEALLAADRAAPRAFLAGDPARSLGPGIGSEIGGYRLLGNPLGEGGMGTVFAALQSSPRREVALKLVRPGRVSPDALRRFQLEVEALGQLHHPGIAQIHEAGSFEVDGESLPYLAMERVHGLSLFEHARRRGLSRSARLELLARVADAVHHAHLRGVIHRDLKADNVLVVDGGTAGSDERRTEPGQPKILDFGIARVIGSEHGSLHTRTGQVMGTLATMSPEQVAGDPRQVDLRTDVWALGVLLYELLAERPPLDLAGLTLPAAARCIQEDEPEPLGRVERALDGDVARIAARALEKDKERRYPSAQALADDLRRHLAGEPILAGPTSRLWLARKFVRRHRLALGAACAIVMALAVGLVLALHERDRAREALADANAVLEFVNEDLLAAARPVAFGQDVTMGDALDRAAERVAGRFEGRPLVAASIHSTLGSTYARLSRLDAAEHHLRRAQELFAESVPPDHARRLENDRRLGSLAKELLRFDEARALLEHVHATRRAALGPEHPDTLRALASLGALAFATQQNDEAAERYREVVARGEEVLGPTHSTVLNAMETLGILAQQGGEYAEARAWMERVVATRKEHLGESHPETIVSMLNLSSFLRRVGEFARASELIESALRLHDEGGGRGDERTVFTLESIAAHLYGVGRYEEALARYDEALALARELFPEAHPMRAWSAACRGGALMRLGRFDEAEEALRPTYEICVERLGPKHQVTRNALRLLAELARPRGNVEEAELACSELLSLEDALSPFERFDALTLRAQARIDLERFDGAQADLEAAADACAAPEAPAWWRSRLLGVAERLFTAWQRPAELERFRARLAP